MTIKKETKTEKALREALHDLDQVVADMKATDADAERAAQEVVAAARYDERALVQADMVDRLAQALQVLLAESENICGRLRQLGVVDADIDASASAIERAVKSADAIVRGRREEAPACTGYADYPCSRPAKWLVNGAPRCGVHSRNYERTSLTDTK